MLLKLNASPEEQPALYRGALAVMSKVKKAIIDRRWGDASVVLTKLRAEIQQAFDDLFDPSLNQPTMMLAGSEHYRRLGHPNRFEKVDWTILFMFFNGADAGVVWVENNIMRTSPKDAADTFIMLYENSRFALRSGSEELNGLARCRKAVVRTHRGRVPGTCCPAKRAMNGCAATSRDTLGDH